MTNLEGGESVNLAGDPDVGQVDLLAVLQRGQRLDPQARLLQLLLGERHLVVVPNRDLRLQRHPRLEDHGVAPHETKGEGLVDHPRFAEAPLYRIHWSSLQVLDSVV